MEDAQPVAPPSKIRAQASQIVAPVKQVAATTTKAIDPEKDVDGLGQVNAGRVALGHDGLVPCTPLGCLLNEGGARAVDFQPTVTVALSAPSRVCNSRRRPIRLRNSRETMGNSIIGRSS